MDEEDSTNNLAQVEAEHCGWGCGYRGCGFPGWGYRGCGYRGCGWGGYRGCGYPGWGYRGCGCCYAETEPVSTEDNGTIEKATEIEGVGKDLGDDSDLGYDCDSDDDCDDVKEDETNIMA